MFGGGDRSTLVYSRSCEMCNVHPGHERDTIVSLELEDLSFSAYKKFQIYVVVAYFIVLAFYITIVYSSYFIASAEFINKPFIKTQ